MADFDERSGIVACPTQWGFWYQTLDEVSVVVDVDSLTKASHIKVLSTCNSLNVTVNGKTVINGKLFNSVKPKGTIWTLETNKEGKLLRIVLQKLDKTTVNTWPSLLRDQYTADEWLLENMRKKAALERLSLENPCYDLSGAEITGNYATGGPEVPS